MILNTPSTSRDVKIILNQHKFPLPVLFDPRNEFKKRNNLPDGHKFHTFLLNENNEVVGVGNPTENPKIRDFYKRIITEDASEIDNYPNFCDKPVEAIGVANFGDTISREFVLWNTSSDTVTIQAVIPSCECIQSYATSDTLWPGKSSKICVKMAVDSTQGSFIKRVAIFYNEKDAEEILTLFGYSDNKP